MLFITFILFFHLIAPKFVYSNKEDLDLTKKKEKVFIVLSFSILFIFSAFRAVEIGNDTLNYYNYYKNIEVFKFPPIYFEKGFVLFSHTLKLFFKNPQWLLIFTSLIILLSLYRFFIDKTNYLWLGILIFILSHTYFGTFNTLRQYLAFVFLIPAYNFYRDKKILPFIIMTILASLFHKSALVFLVLLFTPLLKSRKKALIAILVISTLIIIIPISFYYKIPYFEIYLGSIFDNANRPAAILNSMIVGGIVGLGFIYRSDQEEITFLEKMSLISLFILLLSIKTSVANRLNIYFMPFVIVYLSNTLFMIKEKKEQKIVIGIIISMFILHYYVIAIYRPEWNHIFPYRFFFQK